MEEYMKCPQCGEEVLKTALKPHMAVFCRYKEVPKEAETSAKEAETSAKKALPLMEKTQAINFSSLYKRLSVVNKKALKLEYVNVWTAKTCLDGNILYMALGAPVGVSAEIDPRPIAKWNEPLCFRSSESGVIAQSEDGQWATLPSAELPYEAPYLWQGIPNGCIIDGDGLRRYTKAALSCAGKDASRPVLSCVLMVFEGNGLSLVSADGFRLVKTGRIATSGMDGSVTVPADALAAVAQLNGDILIEVEKEDRNIVRFSSADEAEVVVTGQNLGTFPAYEAVMRPVVDRKHKAWFSCASSDLKKAMRSVPSGSNRRVQSIWVLEVDGGTRVLLKRTETTGDDYTASVEVQKAKCSGTGSVAVNPRFLTEAIDSFGGFVKVMIGKESEVIHINALDNASSANFLVMPMKIYGLEAERASEHDDEEEHSEGDDS